MNKEEIEKILDRLERIDHKEYNCSFEFADSSSFEETCMCFDERKKLANYIKQLQQENKKLKLNHKQLSDIKKMAICNSRLIQENKQLQERIEYLERSNNRREEEIISLRQELADIEVCREKAIEYIKDNLIQNDITTQDYINKYKEVLNILKGEDNE